MAIKSDVLWHAVFWPQPLERESVLGLLRRFAADSHRDPVRWGARGEGGEVRFFVGTVGTSHHRVSNLITTLVPGTILSPLETSPIDADEVARLRVIRPELSLDVSNHGQALRSLLAGLAAARTKGESTVISIVFDSGIAPAFIPPQPPDPTRLLCEAILSGPRAANPEVRGSLRDKAAQFRLRTIVRLGSTAVESTRRTNLVMGLLAGLRTIEAGGTRFRLVREQPGRFVSAASWWRTPLLLTVEELLIVLGWPVGEHQLPGQPPHHPRQLRPGTDGGETGSRDFAVSTAPGQKVRIGISTKDSLYHSLFIGPTGSGKSTALLNLIVQDMRDGKPLVVIDPKADLVASILARVPSEREGDIVVLDSMSTSPVGLNPLAHATEETSELVADGILSVLKDLFASSWGVRTADVMHAALLTLARHGRMSLLQLPRLLTDAAFRRTLTGALDDPIGLEPFWAQFEAMSPQQQAQVISPTLTRLRQLLLRPSLRNVLGQVAPKFDLADVFTQKRILLVPLNKGLIGPEAARLLGSLLVAELWQLSLGRAVLPEAERHPISIVVDEMQDYVHLPTDVSDALSQSRSLGVAWHLAHQFRNQLSDSLQSAVDANARNLVSFGLDVTDATAMARKSLDLVAADFMALPKFHVYASLMIDGQKQSWVSGRTLPPPPTTSDAAALRALSERTYGQVLTAEELGDPQRGAAPHSVAKESAAAVRSDSKTSERFGRRRKEKD